MDIVFFKRRCESNDEQTFMFFKHCCVRNGVHFFTGNYDLQAPLHTQGSERLAAYVKLAEAESF